MELISQKDPCMYCGKKAMRMTYRGNYQYQISCSACRKSFDFPAISQAEAKRIYRYLSKKLFS